MDVILIWFVIGIFIGSFLNVLADRLPNNRSPLKGRSLCDSCQKELAPLDLIPLFSFLFLKGRCRYCSSRLSLYYPIVEFTTGLLFILTFIYVISGGILNSQFSIFNEFINYKSLIINLSYYLFLISCLIVIFFSDLRYRIIPDKIVFPAVIVTFVFLIISHQSLVINHLLSALGAFVFFFLIFLITRGRGLGFGDVKLSFLIGLILGFPSAIFAIYLAFLTGAGVSIILILIGLKKFKKSTIAFGPFLILGTVINIYFANQITKIFLEILRIK